MISRVRSRTPTSDLLLMIDPNKYIFYSWTMILTGLSTMESR